MTLRWPIASVLLLAACGDAAVPSSPADGGADTPAVVDTPPPLDVPAPTDIPPPPTDIPPSPTDIPPPPIDNPPSPIDIPTAADVPPPRDVPVDTPPPVDAPSVVSPEDPGPADVHFDIDAVAAGTPISPFIYGTNQPDWTTTARRLALTRMGGNRLTAYNWETNASNAGSDYRHQNDNYLCQTAGCAAPGEAVRRAVAPAHAAGAAIILTVPAAGHVAADALGNGDVNATPDFLNTRFHVSVPRKGSALSLTPSLTDGRVYQDEFVNWVERSFPAARTDPRRAIFYEIDNEPDLWSSTHPRIHPAPVGYAELITRTVDTAAAIRSVAPTALVFGPVNYGFNGMVSLQDAPDRAGRDFLDTWLDAMRAAETTAGRRLVDVLDVHFYSEARGDGVRVADANDARGAAARVQAPRSLWDPTYREDSWITNDYLRAPIRLIARLREKVAAHYPGTRLALTEYNHGGGADVSGAIAQADTLGVLGREGVFAAALWHLADDQRWLYAGFAMFRDYDGAGAAFGDTSLPALTDDVARAAVYASRDAGRPERVVLVAINRGTAALTAAVRVTAAGRLARVERWQLTAAGLAPARLPDAAPAARNALRLTLPPRSVSTLVLRF
jgi:hypothetical protein